MTGDAKGAPLREAVGSEPPGPLVDALDAGQIAALAAEVSAARTRQREALAQAGDDALRHVPKLLRGALQRMLR